MQPQPPINNSNQRRQEPSYPSSHSQNSPSSAFNNLPKDVLTSLLEGKVDMALQQLSNNQKKENRNVIIHFFKSVGRLIFIFKFTTPQHQPHKKTSNKISKNSPTIQVDPREITDISQKCKNNSDSSINSSKMNDLSNKRSILKTFVLTSDQIIHTILKNMLHLPQKTSQALSPYLSKMVQPVKDLVDAIKVKNEIFIKWSTPKIQKFLNPIQQGYQKAAQHTSIAIKKVNHFVEQVKNQLNQRIINPIHHYIAPRLNQVQNRIQSGFNQLKKSFAFPALKTLFQKGKKIEPINNAIFLKEDKNKSMSISSNIKANKLEEIQSQALMLANQHKSKQNEIDIYKTSPSIPFFKNAIKAPAMALEQVTQSIDRFHKTLQQFMASTAEKMGQQSAQFLNKMAQVPLIKKFITSINSIPKIFERGVENLKSISDKAITMILIPCKVIGNSLLKGLNRLGGMSYKQYKKMESLVEGVARGIAEIAVGFYRHFLEKIIKNLMNFIVWLSKKIWKGIAFLGLMLWKGIKGVYYFVIATPGILKEFIFHLFGLARRWASWVFG